MTGYNPSSFTITGSGFTPNGGIGLNISNGITSFTAVSNTTADSNGNINITVPSSILNIGSNTPTGAYNGSIEAIDSTTGIKSNTINITITVTLPPTSASLSVSPSTTYYSSGGTVTFTGSGFAPNSEIAFTAYYGNSAQILPATATTDSNGNFSEGFNYPGGGVLDGIMASYTGTITMYATDDKGTSASASWYNYTGSSGTAPPTSASLSVSPSTTYYSSGGTLTFTGSGFAPNSTVTFSVNYLTPLPATTTTDSNGNFSIKFNYPGGGVLDSIMSQITGNITMTAVDNSNNSASATWYNYA